MSLHYEPPQLRELALQAFGEYVTSLCLQRYFVGYYKQQKVCKYVEYLINETVPSDLADEVTAELLKHLKDVCKKDIWLNKKPLITEIVVPFVRAVIHPSVTRLDFAVDLSHAPRSDHDDAWDHIVPYVFHKLESLEKLKVLRIMEPQSHRVKNKVFPTMKSLEELTFMGHCHKKLLKQLVESCKKLKKLDVRSSNLVNESCIDTLLELSSLEDVNFYGTYINEPGMTQFLTGLAEREKSGNPVLKGFACTNLTTYQFSFLINNFTNLTKLQFNYNSGCEFEILKQLKHLKAFSIKDACYTDICKIVSAVGSQLISLHIGSYDPIDLYAIAENCPSLECLHVKSSCDFVPRHRSKRLLSNFRSVKCLYLNSTESVNMVTCLMSHCPNVEVMNVMVYRGDIDSVIGLVLKNNPLSCLKKFTLVAKSLTRGTAKMIVEHCPNLSYLLGTFVWTKYCNVKQLMLEGVITEEMLPDILVRSN